MWWSVHILAVVGDLAVVQGPGGMVVVDDPGHALTPGVSTTVVTTPAGAEVPAGLQLGTWTWQRSGPVIVFQREAEVGCPPVRMPLFLQSPEEPSSARVHLTMSIPVACARCDPAEAWSYLIQSAEPDAVGALEFFNALLRRSPSP